MASVNRTEEQGNKLQLIFVLKNFPGDRHKQLTHDQVNWFKRNHHSLKRAKWIEKMRVDLTAANLSCISQDLARLARGGFTEMAPLGSEVTRGEVINDVLGVLNLVGFMGNTTTARERQPPPR